MRHFLLFLLCCMIFCTPLSADYVDDNPVEAENPVESFDSLPDISEAFTPPAETQAPATTAIEAPEREPAPSGAGIMPVDSTYGGSWNGATLDYFSGIMRAHPFKDYLVFRRDQYNYILYYGSDIKLNGSTFQGTDLTCVVYSSNSGYNNEYISTSTNQSISINVDGLFYTNVSDVGARLEGVTQIEWTIAACVLLGLGIGISLVRGFFK